MCVLAWIVVVRELRSRGSPPSHRFSARQSPDNSGRLNGEKEEEKEQKERKDCGCLNESSS